MNLHFAAVYANGIGLHGKNWNKLTTVQQTHRMQVEYVLESYHYFNKPQIVNEVRKSGERVFLDSGAFSAWTQGVTIDIGEYCTFLQTHADAITHASVLDVIGDADATYVNLKEMERRGCKVLPCYHQGEDLRYLEYYVRNYDYITLGGLVGTSALGLIKWLDELWERYLLDGSGKPRTRVHAFGVNAISVMRRYPWYSIDAASWRLSAVNGQIFHPEIGTIDIGAKRQSKKELNKHFLTLAPPYQQKVQSFIESRGYSVDDLANSDLSRSIFNMNSYMEANREIRSSEINFNQEQPGIF